MGGGIFWSSSGVEDYLLHGFQNYYSVVTRSIIPFFHTSKNKKFLSMIKFPFTFHSHVVRNVLVAIYSMQKHNIFTSPNLIRTLPNCDLIDDEKLQLTQTQ